MKKKCEWAEGDPEMMNYHDTEWGVPIYGDRLLFEFSILAGGKRTNNKFA